MQEEESYDPFQLQNAPTAQRFSVQEKIMAIVLVVIFATIPLYEISSDAFKVNYVYENTTISGCIMDYFPLPTSGVEYLQGEEIIKQLK